MNAFVHALAMFLAMFLQGTGPGYGTITTAGSTCGATNCVYYDIPSNVGNVSITVGNIGTQTLQFEAAGNGNDPNATAGGTMGAKPCTLVSDGSTIATSTTTNGAWGCSVSGLTRIQVRGSAVTGIGTARVVIQGSLALSGSGAGGTGGAPGATGPTGPTGPTNTLLASSYGCVGDNVKAGGSGGQMSSTVLPHLLNIGGAPATFVPGDVGKAVVVNGAGVAGADLITTIATYNSASQVVLTAAASTTATNVVTYFGTDNTTCVSNLLAAMYSGSNTKGGVSVGQFAAGNFLVTGQIAIPNDGSGGTAPQQPPMRLTGMGGGFTGQGSGSISPPPSGGTILDLRYVATGSTDAKIVSFANGILEIDHMQLRDEGTDIPRFIYSTNTNDLLHNLAIYGSTVRGSVCSTVVDCGTAITLGGTTTSLGVGPTAPFQGYASDINNVNFDYIGTALLVRVYGNAVRSENCAVWTNSGGVAPIQIAPPPATSTADGSVITGWLLEVQHYQYGANLVSANQNTINLTIFDTLVPPALAAFNVTDSVHNVLSLAETGAGDLIYRGLTLITGNSSASNTVTTGDGIYHAVVNGDVTNNNGNYNFAPEPAPIIPVLALVATSSGNVTAGAHSCVNTIVTSAGETIPSTFSNAVTADGTHKQLTAALHATTGLGFLAGFNVYCTKAGVDPSVITNYFLVASSPVISSTSLNTVTYTLNIADGSFLATKPPTFNTTGGAIKSSGTIVARVDDGTAYGAPTFQLPIDGQLLFTDSNLGFGFAEINFNNGVVSIQGDDSNYLSVGNAVVNLVTSSPTSSSYKINGAEILRTPVSNVAQVGGGFHDLFLDPDQGAGPQTVCMFGQSNSANKKFCVDSAGVTTAYGLAGSGTRTVLTSSTGVLSAAVTPIVSGTGRVTGQTAANASIATLTVGASDTSYYISGEIEVTTSTLYSFTMTCTYTDPANVSRTLTMNFSGLTGVFSTVVANTSPSVIFEGVPQHIRAKAGTTITIATAAGGVYTTVTYNAEGRIIAVGS